MANTAEGRLNIRVQPAVKRVLEEAAEASHLNLSDFVRQAAERHAEEVLLERHTVRLTPEAARSSTDALQRPAAANERLAAALRRPRRFNWLG